MLCLRPAGPRRSRRHAVALVAAAALMAATLLPSSPAPFTTPGARAGGTKPPACTAEQVKPNLGDLMVNQGLNYPILNRGKQTLVRLFLRLPTTCSTTSAITMTGATLIVTLTYGPSTITSSPLSPIQLVSGTLTAGLQSNAASDPLFLVPASVLTPPASWTLSFKTSFTATVFYKVGTDPTPRSLTFTTGPTGLPLEAPFEPKTSALRILVVPMGDASSTATQFSSAAQAAVQNALLDLSRMGPFPDGVVDLTSMATGGVRYSIDPGLMDIGPKSGTPAIPTSGTKFCGSASNFATISNALTARLQNYNLLNPNAQADRALGVIDAAISTGATGGCDEGRAAVPSGGKSAVAAWVRAVPDGTYPSQTGAVLAQEILHTFAGCSSASSSDTRCPVGTYHSTTTTDFSNSRGYNLATRAWLSKPPTIMKYNSAASIWNRTTTLYETSDYLLFSCILTPGFVVPAGSTGVPGCTTATTGSAGTSVGVPAGPTFFLSGSTDGVGTETSCPAPPNQTTARYQAPGTTVFDSFFKSTTADLNGDVDDSSQYRLRYYDAGGNELADFGVPTGSSGAPLDMGSTTTSPGRTIFSAAFEWDVSTTDVQQVRLVRTSAGGSAVVLWCRNRTEPPVISSAVSTGADDTPCPEIGVGGLIAYIDTDIPGGGGPASIWATRCGTDRRLIWRNPGPDHVDYPVWSPDGSRLAYWDWNYHSFRVVNADGSGEHGIGAGMGAYLRLTWSPDGSRIAYLLDVGATGTTMRIVDAADGSVVADVTYPGVTLYSPAWSPDGAQFVGGDQGDLPGGVGYARIILVNVDGSGVPTEVLNADSALPGLVAFGHHAWSPDGSLIAFVGDEAATSHVLLVGVEGGPVATIASTAAPTHFVRPTWSADGQSILAGLDGGPTTQIVSLRLDDPGQAPRVVIDDTARPSASWGPSAAGALGTITTPTPDDVTVTLTYTCPGTGQVYPVAIGISAAKVGDAAAQFFATFDPTQACASGTLEAIAKDGISASDPAPIGALALASTPPIAAIDNPVDGRTYGWTDTISLKGHVLDPETGSLCESTSSACEWSITSGGTAVEDVATGPTVDLIAGDERLSPFMDGMAWKTGTYTATLTATGVQGTTATASVAFTISVRYSNVSGVQQPINPDNTSVFARNRVVPVKFQIPGSPTSTGYPTSAWTVKLQSVACTSFDQLDAVVEQIPSSTPYASFRWDPVSQQYVYNAQIGSLASGTCWVFRITLDDGTDQASPTVVTSPVFKTK